MLVYIPPQPDAYDFFDFSNIFFQKQKRVFMSSLKVREIAQSGNLDALFAVDALAWAVLGKVKLQSGKFFQTVNHEYQRAIMQCDHPNQCAKKGAQIGVTEINVLKTIHGHIYGRYPTGTLYLFPTWNDVSDFSKARFNPLIYDNPQISVHVKTINAGGKTMEAATIKKIGNGILYLRSARQTAKIDGLKADSSSLKSIPVDRIVFDERDTMADSMVDLALERVSHSDVGEVFQLSTPTIPDYGIDLEYQKSDQRIWEIRCTHCNTYTCLELEFPGCLKYDTENRVYRACKKCGKEIFPKDGRWVPQRPEVKDLVGWWISQLNSMFVDPAKILEKFEDPKTNLQEFYNSKLGMAYIDAENRLTTNDVLSCCGRDPMMIKDNGPCSMGADIGKHIHVVIGSKKVNTLKVLKVATVSSFNDLHDLGSRFGVKCAVLDLYPETRKVREFAAAEKYPVFGCDYQERQKGAFAWDERNKVVTVNRTEVCDATHDLIMQKGRLELPRRSDELDIYIKHMTGIVKVLQEDETTGSRVYRYRRIADDHYRHATNYFYLASTRTRDTRPSHSNNSQQESFKYPYAPV